MDLDAYLARIGLDHRPLPTLEGLCTVQRAHPLAISYENLDVQLGRPVTIERPAIFDKIVTRGRGGWCYEMNGLLGWALEELGFDVTRVTGAVMREAGGDAQIANHLVLRVELPEGTYIADVGFADSLMEPFKLEEGGFVSNTFAYNLARADGDWWRLTNHPFGVAKSFDFDPAPADEGRFAAMCANLQTAPDSLFVQNLLCFRQRPGAVDSLRGRALGTITPTGIETRLLNDEGELVAALRDVFALDVPEAATLWPKICARHEEVFAQRAATG